MDALRAPTHTVFWPGMEKEWNYTQSAIWFIFLHEPWLDACWLFLSTLTWAHYDNTILHPVEFQMNVTTTRRIQTHLWQSHAKNKNKAMRWNYLQFSFTYNCTFALFIPTLEHLEIGVSPITSVWILWLQQLVNIFWDVCGVWDARALQKVYCLLFFRKWGWKRWIEVERESRRQEEGKKQIM